MRRILELCGIHQLLVNPNDINLLGKVIQWCNQREGTGNYLFHIIFISETCFVSLENMVSSSSGICPEMATLGGKKQLKILETVKAGLQTAINQRTRC
jgi:hypothetical protein